MIIIQDGIKNLSSARNGHTGTGNHALEGGSLRNRLGIRVAGITALKITIISRGAGSSIGLPISRQPIIIIVKTTCQYFIGIVG